MEKAKKGDRVSIDFIGKLNDGTIFDTTFDDGQCEEDHCCLLYTSDAADE